MSRTILPYFLQKDVKKELEDNTGRFSKNFESFDSESKEIADPLLSYVWPKSSELTPSLTILEKQ